MASKRQRFTDDPMDTDESSSLSSSSIDSDGNESFDDDGYDENLYIFKGSSVTLEEANGLVKNLFLTFPLSDSVKLAIILLLQTLIPNLNLSELHPKNESFCPYIKTSKDGVDNYFICDFKAQIEKMVNNYKIAKDFCLDIFIDGFSIDKKFSQPFWGIIGYISSPSFSKKISTMRKNIIVFGVSKPTQNNSKPSRQFIAKVFHQIKEANYRVGKLILDMPAKTFVLGHSGQHSRNGCVYCFIPVTRIGGVPVFSYDYFTSGEYKQKTPLHYHMGVEDCFECNPYIPEELAPFHCIVDILHLFGAGLCKRLLECLISTTHGLDNYITEKKHKNFKGKLNKILSSIQLPKQATIDHKDLKLFGKGSWKSKTTIYFFLYFITSLKPFVPYYQFQSLILLSDIIYLISYKPALSEADYNSLYYLVHNLFCVDFAKCWGDIHCTANFHNLIHIVEEIKRLDYCSPAYYSAFPMESYFTYLKNKVFGSSLSLEQMGYNVNFFINNQNFPDKKEYPPFIVKSKATKKSNNSLAFDTNNNIFFEIFKIEGEQLYGFKIETSPVVNYDTQFKGHIYKIKQRPTQIIHTSEISKCKIAIICKGYISIMVDYSFM